MKNNVPRKTYNYQSVIRPKLSLYQTTPVSDNFVDLFSFFSSLNLRKCSWYGLLQFCFCVVIVEVGKITKRAINQWDFFYCIETASFIANDSLARGLIGKVTLMMSTGRFKMGLRFSDVQLSINVGKGDGRVLTKRILWKNKVVD